MRAPTFAEFERLSDAELKARYDAAAATTDVWLGFYLDELRRRALARQASMMFWLTVVVTIATLVNVAIVVFD